MVVLKWFIDGFYFCFVAVIVMKTNSTYNKKDIKTVTKGEAPTT
jgi:hypothetical protein